MVLLDKREELPDLVRLGLAANRLEVELFGHLGVPVDVMAAPYPAELKAICFDESLEVPKTYIRHCAAGEPAKKPPRVHAADSSEGVRHLG
jgi:hypothetical protein